MEEEDNIPAPPAGYTLNTGRGSTPNAGANTTSTPAPPPGYTVNTGAPAGPDVNRDLDQQTLQVMRRESPGSVDRLYQENPQGFIPTGDEPGYTAPQPNVSGREFAESDEATISEDASMMDRRNWPAIAADLAGGVYEGARRLAELTPQRQFTSMASEALFGEDVTEDIQPPEYRPEISRTAVELGATAAPTFKGAQAASAASKALTPFARNLMGTIGGTAGYAVSKRPGEDRVVMGEDALLPVMGEIFPDADEETLQGRSKELVNDFADAMVLAYPGERAADLGLRTATAINNTVLKPFYQSIAGGQRGLEETVGNQIATVLDMKQSFGDDRQGFLESLASRIREHGRINVGDRTIVRDTMSAVEEGATDEATRIRARNIRAGELAKTGPHTPDLEIAVSRPSREARGFIEQTQEALGGQEAVEEAGAGVQRQARGQFEEGFEAPVRAQEEAITSRAQDLDAIFAEDPEFAPLLERLDTENVNIDIRGAANRSVDETRDAVTQAYEGMKEGLNERVQQIPRGNIISLEGFEDTISELPKSRLTDSGLDPETMEGDFRDLYENLVPELSKRISRMINNRSGDPQDLIDLRNAINKAAADIPEGEEFMRYYRQDFAPFWKDGKLEGFANVHGRTIGRAPDIGTVNFEAETSNLIDQMAGNPAYSGHLDSLLRRKEAGVKPELQTNMIFGEVAAQIQSQLNAGKNLDEIDLSTILSPLEKYGASLSRINSDQASRVNNLIGRIRSAKGDLKDMGDVLKDLEKRRDKGQATIFNREYKEFFDSLGDEVPDKYNSFSKLIESGDTDRISRIVDVAPENVRQGMKVSFMRQLQNSMFTKGRVPGGEKAINLEKLSDAEEGASSVYRVGQEIFKDTPETYDMLTGLLREAGRMSESLSKSRSEKVVDPGAITREGGAAADKLITVFFGVLNRIAARARAGIKGTLLPSMSPTDTVEEITGRFMADPEYAESIIRRLANKKKYSPEDRRAFIDMALLATGNDGDNQDIIEEAVDTELQSRNLYDQTTDMLGIQ